MTDEERAQALIAAAALSSLANAIAAFPTDALEQWWPHLDKMTALVNEKAKSPQVAAMHSIYRDTLTTVKQLQDRSYATLKQAGLMDGDGKVDDAKLSQLLQNIRTTTVQ